MEAAHLLRKSLSFLIAATFGAVLFDYVTFIVFSGHSGWGRGTTGQFLPDLNLALTLVVAAPVMGVSRLLGISSAPTITLLMYMVNALLGGCVFIGATFIWKFLRKYWL